MFRYAFFSVQELNVLGHFVQSLACRVVGPLDLNHHKHLFPVARKNIDEATRSLRISQLAVERNKFHAEFYQMELVGQTVTQYTFVHFLTHNVGSQVASMKTDGKLRHRPQPSTWPRCTLH
jgi:hypothetical protein